MNKRITKKLNKLCTTCLFEDLCKSAKLTHCKHKAYYKRNIPGGKQL